MLSEIERRSKAKHESYPQIRDLHYEKASKPYFGLERKMRMKNDRIITEMKAFNSSKVCRRSHSIVKEAVFPYYKQLYSKKETLAGSQKTCLDSYTKIVPKEFRDKLSTDFCKHDVEEAIDQLANGKSPGADGISINFYKKFKKIIAPKLTEMYYLAVKKGNLPSSTRNSVISM